MQIFCSFYPQNKQIEGIFLFDHRLNKLNGLFFFLFSSSKIFQNNPPKDTNHIPKGHNAIRACTGVYMCGVSR